MSNGLLLNDKDKKNQGLRQFSLRVCRQVEAKMTTTYNEVADELVKEFKDEETDSDEKNIRRYCLRDLVGVCSGRVKYVHREAGESS